MYIHFFLHPNISVEIRLFLALLDVQWGSCISFLFGWFGQFKHSLMKIYPVFKFKTGWVNSVEQWRLIYRRITHCLSDEECLEQTGENPWSIILQWPEWCTGCKSQSTVIRVNHSIHMTPAARARETSLLFSNNNKAIIKYCDGPES